MNHEQSPMFPVTGGTELEEKKTKTPAQPQPELTREQMLADAEQLLAAFALDYERMAQ